MLFTFYGIGVSYLLFSIMCVCVALQWTDLICSCLLLVGNISSLKIYFKKEHTTERELKSVLQFKVETLKCMLLLFNMQLIMSCLFTAATVLTAGTLYRFPILTYEYIIFIYKGTRHSVVG
jgi:hypothetical protein